MAMVNPGVVGAAIACLHCVTWAVMVAVVAAGLVVAGLGVAVVVAYITSATEGCIVLCCLVFM